MKKGKTLIFLVRGNIQQKGEVQNFGHERGQFFPVPPLVTNPDSSIKNTLGIVLGPITAVILKRMRESIFFQRNRFTAYKVRDGKYVAQSLMVFNLRKIIDPI